MGKVGQFRGNQTQVSAPPDVAVALAVLNATFGNGMHPPSDPPNGGGDPGDDGMADLLARVSRLETGFLAACTAVIVGGLALFFIANGNIHAVEKSVGDVRVEVSSARGDIKSLDERTAAMQRQQDKMDAKLDQLIDRK